MADKLALIDKDLLLRLLSKNVDTNPTPPANPILREMRHINDNISTTLESEDAPAQIQTQKVNELLSKHDNFHQKFENQQPAVTTQNRSFSVSNGDVWFEKVLDATPGRF